MFSWVAYGNRGEQIAITATAAPRLAIHGLPPAATREAVVRVRSACCAIGLSPNASVHVSSPLPGGFDLAIAIAALDAASELGARHAPLLCGNLSLSGKIHPVRGLYSALSSSAGSAVIVPAEQAGEAALTGAKCMEASTLADVVRYFQGAELPVVAPRDAKLEKRPAVHTARDVQWRHGHAVLLVGPPGSGLVLEARAAAARLEPPDNPYQTIAALSTAGILDPGQLWVPFRAPHHTVSEAGLVGSRGRPGEVSLAHGGCLLLDEAHEYRKSALETLAHVVRAGEAVTYQVAAGAASPWFAARPQLIIGTCPPDQVERARKLYPWTGEIELARLSVADLLAGGEP